MAPRGWCGRNGVPRCIAQPVGIYTTSRRVNHRAFARPVPCLCPFCKDTSTIYRLIEWGFRIFASMHIFTKSELFSQRLLYTMIFSWIRRQKMIVSLNGGKPSLCASQSLTWDLFGSCSGDMLNVTIREKLMDNCPSVSPHRQCKSVALSTDIKKVKVRTLFCNFQFPEDADKCP